MAPLRAASRFVGCSAGRFALSALPRVSPGVDVEERIVESLRQLGLTTTEARTYVALLKSHPATGYEVAARSEVPRSAIYGVLHRLEGLGLINPIQQKPAKFVPLPPERLLELFRSRFDRSLEQLEGSLSSFDAQVDEAPTWSVRGYAPLLELARGLIDASEQVVHASLWRREALALEAPLRRAVERGVNVVLFSFNDLPEGLGRRLAYGIPESKLESYWGHKLILVADRRRMLVGGAELTESNRGVVTEETTLIEMATSNLVLDLTLYGERTGETVSDIISGLTQGFAPVEELLRETRGS